MFLDLYSKRVVTIREPADDRQRDDLVVAAVVACDSNREAKLGTFTYDCFCWKTFFTTVEPTTRLGVHVNRLYKRYLAIIFLNFA